MVNVSRDVAKFLEINISENEELFLTHYSSSEAPKNLADYEAVGNAFFTLIACHLSVSIKNQDEKLLDKNKQLIEKHLIKELSNKLSNSPIYPKVSFGAGITDQELQSESLSKVLLLILVGQVVCKGYFKELYVKWLSIKRTISDNQTYIDFKTILQEELQKVKRSVPVYETIEATGPQHDQLFKVKAKVDSTNAIAEGKSKKLAQQAAARLLLKKINPNKLIKSQSQIVVNGGSLLFYKQGLGKLPSTVAPSVYEAFNISTHINLMPSIIHPRFRKSGYWGEKSHRSLAMLGADLLDVFLAMQVVKLSSNENFFGHNSASLAQITLSNQRLVSIYDSGFLNIGKPPLKHDDFLSIPYKVDCVQSLFAISFLHSLEENNLELIQQSYAMDWILKRINYLYAKENINLKNISTLALERLQALGMLFSFENHAAEISIRLTSVKSGNSFVFSPSHNLDFNKDIKQYASSLLLKILDAYEGVGLSPNLTNNQFEGYFDLGVFLDTELITNRKKIASQNGIKVDKLELSNLKQFKDTAFEELLIEWRNQELSVIEKVEVLARIRIYLGLNKSLKESLDYQFLPIIFDNYYSDINSNSIIDFPEAEEEKSENLEDNVSLAKDIPFTNTNKIQNYTNNSQSNLKIEKDKITIKAVKPKLHAQTDKVEVKTVESDTSLAKRRSERDIQESLTAFENKVSTMNISEIESLWNKKEKLLDSIEEAAIVLSHLRYERGIDFQRLKYTKFMNSELFSKTSLISAFIPENPCKIVQKTKQNKTKQNVVPNLGKEFNVEQNDERNFVSRKMALRKGQSRFRKNMMTLWKNCCISGCEINSIIEAAHVAPFRGEKDHHIQNGLILRVDIHRLFDSYLIGINPDTMEIELAPQLMDSEYIIFRGAKIKSPSSHTISKKALIYRWHSFCQNNGLEFSLN